MLNLQFAVISLENKLICDCNHTAIQIKDLYSCLEHGQCLLSLVYYNYNYVVT